MSSENNPQLVTNYVAPVNNAAPVNYATPVQYYYTTQPVTYYTAAPASQSVVYSAPPVSSEPVAYETAPVVGSSVAETNNDPTKEKSSLLRNKKFWFIVGGILAFLAVCGIVLGLIPVYLNGKI